MPPARLPELLAPAGSLDAVRAALANGADAVYLGAERFNARDEGAQLTLNDLEEACRLAHGRGRRIYLTLNTLVKPGELADALTLLGECIDRGVDAAIVQDVGLVCLIHAVYPGFELHGSTQLTVHDASGAAVMHALGLQRVVLAREDTLDDIRAIRGAVPELELECFIHGALCISYSGQCYMSGMISERSANRGSCAQSCRKDYTLTDAESGETLDSGFLISARDLAAHEHLDAIADAGIHTLKIEGRKKKPEYVATVTSTYRELLERVRRGEPAMIAPESERDLVQIFSRGFTGGMYGGRAGRSYVTRDHPDNHGAPLGEVVDHAPGEIIVELSAPLAVGDGIAFEPLPSLPAAGDRDVNAAAGANGSVRTARFTSEQGRTPGPTSDVIGFSVTGVRTLTSHAPDAPSPARRVRQAIASRARVPVGARVLRTSHAGLLERARASFASLAAPAPERRVRLDVRAFGSAGGPLKLVFTAAGASTEAVSEVPLAPARQHALGDRQLREQLGRLGGTPFALGAVDHRGLAPGLFLPVSELNALRQRAVEQLTLARDWASEARLAERREQIERAIASVRIEQRVGALASPPAARPASDEPLARVAVAAPFGKAVKAPSGDAVAAPRPDAAPFRIAADVHRLDDARAAAQAGATEISFDPFLRHPVPPVARLSALAAELAARGVVLRLRTPTIVRPTERAALDRWLELELPVLSGHVGLVSELARSGRDVVADYAVNCFNQHTAAEYFALGAARIVLSVELTTGEIGAVVAPWQGRDFDVVLYGRPEGMTIEHCVLSAAFDREPTTCRDLCVQKHPRVELTDPAGYTFPVATDAACRNRLLHSRPIEGSEFLPALWRTGIRGVRLLFNVPGEPVGEIVARYRGALEALSRGTAPPRESVRDVVGTAFTRGHFARAV